MGRVCIQAETIKSPITLMGKEAGICWGADGSDTEKNYKRGLDCLSSGHGRVAEYPQVYMEFDGYSARVIREFYTHIGGSPTRLQASTRYVDYENGFSYVTPVSVRVNSRASAIYENTMKELACSLNALEEMGIPREDCAMLLPLGMTTRIVVRTNLRNLIDMSHQRLCSRAYWEFRHLMDDMCMALSDYSEEWAYVIEHYFKPKCELYGYCTEKQSCGRMPKKGGNAK